MNASTPPRRGLGRGLGSLIPTAPPATNGDGVASHAVPGGAGGAADGDMTSQVGSSAATSGADGVPSNARVVAGAWFAELPITEVRPNARQPRTVFDEKALAELVHSIREVGLLQPVVVLKRWDPYYERIVG